MSISSMRISLSPLLEKKSNEDPQFKEGFEDHRLYMTDYFDTHNQLALGTIERAGGDCLYDHIKGKELMPELEKKQASTFKNALTLGKDQQNLKLYLTLNINGMQMEKSCENHQIKTKLQDRVAIISLTLILRRY